MHVCVKDTKNAVHADKEKELAQFDEEANVTILYFAVILSHNYYIHLLNNLMGNYVFSLGFYV